MGSSGVPKGEKGIYTPPKLDITTYEEYVANLVNVNICCKHATVQFITRV